MDGMKCMLCGFKFNAAAHTACGGCIINSKCHLTRCPHCGYETVPDSALVTWVRKLLSRWNVAA
jgi:hypothetical protein